MNLTTEQKHVIKSIIQDVKRGNQQVITLSGYAGTGKTVCASALYAFFPNFATCAYTGKACSIMREKGMRNAATIHSTIYYPSLDEDGKRIFSLKARSMLGFDGFIIDEGSMVGKEEFNNLLSFGLPLIFIGDHGQLEPVGSDVNVMKNPMYKLEEIHRNAGEIAFFAEHIRKGGNVWDFPATHKVQVAYANEATNEIISGTDQIICAFNNTRKGVNNNVRRLLKKGSTVEKGDRIICLRNNKADGIFNGMHANVYEVDLTRKKITIDLDSGERIWDLSFAPQQFDSETTLTDIDYQINLFDFGYCITTHKCVAPDTLVETEEGLLPIRSIANTGHIATPYGFQSYNNFVHNPAAKAFKITTSAGYSVTVTPEHGLDVFSYSTDDYQRVEAKNIRVKNIIRMKLGANIDPVDECKILVNGDFFHFCTEEVAEWMGLFIAGGFKINETFVFSSKSNEVIEQFSKLTWNIFNIPFANGHYKINSAQLNEWIDTIGQIVPECVLRSPLRVQTKFLRGLFDGSSVNVFFNADHYINFFKSPEILRVVQIMLLRLGIISKNWLTGMMSLYYTDAFKFGQLIGFADSEKMNRCRNIKCKSNHYLVPIDRNEASLLDNHSRWISRDIARHMSFMQERLSFHHDKIVTIEEVESESMCVEVPVGHQFLQNGICGWNSQGSEWGNVVVYEQVCKKWDHVRWSYTSASRAKNNLIWLCPSKR